MGRERDEDSGRYTDTYTDDEFIEAIKGEGGLAGTGEIATTVGCSHRQALNRLKELEEKNIVISKDVGRSLAWQLADRI
jgi:predicted ArsR family transcriptional regulator